MTVWNIRTYCWNIIMYINKTVSIDFYIAFNLTYIVCVKMQTCLSFGQPEINIKWRESHQTMYSSKKYISLSSWRVYVFYIRWCLPDENNNSKMLLVQKLYKVLLSHFLFFFTSTCVVYLDVIGFLFFFLYQTNSFLIFYIMFYLFTSLT